MNTKHTNESTTTFVTRGLGYQRNHRGGVGSFSILGLDDPEDERLGDWRRRYALYLTESVCMQVGEWQVPLWGQGHNLYPQEVDALIRENKLLPGLLRKQEDFLYGHGPYLYREVVEDGRRVRVPVQDPDIEAWLARWEEQGVESVEEYLRHLIGDFYRVRTCVSRWHLTTARRYRDNRAGSILALSYVGADRARLATRSVSPMQTVQNSDCRHVVIGDWLRPGLRDFEVYDRFDPANPWRSAAPVSFCTAKSFGRHVYAYNDWFEGLREWIRAGNLTPRYLNSYLRNALNAHIHVRIPLAWWQQKEDTLKNLCMQNETIHNAGGDSRQIVQEYGGVTLVDPQTHTPYFYNANMMEDLVAGELEKITRMLSGEGKNQGKLYASTKMGDEGWDFVEFPGKFKEYFESVISYDKRADQVTLAGIGINSSITNVENDGVISKSGSDVYYNYMVYLNSLTYPEQFVTRELNRAIRLNFPHAARAGIRLGLDIQVPVRQQDTTPADRLDRQKPV